MHQPHSTRNIGELGQDHFKSWCTAARMWATKSAPDYMGWDYFVEFEPEINLDLPLDRESNLRKVLIQVKSTDRPSGSVRAKLSALKRLVDADLPAFIVYIDYSGQEMPRTARLLHVGLKQIEEILKRIRQAERDGRSDLNKVLLSLSLREAVDIDENGRNIRDLIRSLLPDRTVEYIKKKADFRRSCGYAITADFSFLSDRGSELLVDLLIGQTSELKITSASIDKRRFDISLPKDTDVLSEGILKVELKSVQTALVRIRPNILGSRPIEMEAAVYTPGLPFIQKEQLKIRVSNDHIDIVAHFGEKSATFKFAVDHNVRLPLGKITNLLRFSTALPNSDSAIEIDFGAPGLLKLDLRLEGKPDNSYNVLSEFSDLLATALFRHKRITDHPISIVELDKLLDKNKAMFSMLTCPGLKLTSCLDEKLSSATPNNGTLFVPICIEFEPFAYAAIAEIDISSLRVEESTNIMSITGGKPRIFMDDVVRMEEFEISTLNIEAARVAQLQSSSGKWVISTTLQRED